MDGREPPTSGSLALPHRQRFRLVSARRALVGLGGVPDVRARGLLGTQAYDPVFACTAFKLFLTRRSSPATSVASASGRGGPSGGPARCRVPVMSLIYGVDLLTTLHSRRDCEMCYVFFKRTATNHHSQRCGRGVARLVGAVGPSLRQLRNMRRTPVTFSLSTRKSYASRISHIIIVHAPRHVDVSLVRTCLLAASRMLHNRVRNRSCPHDGTPARDALAQCSQPPPAPNPASSPPPRRLRRRPC